MTITFRPIANLYSGQQTTVKPRFAGFEREIASSARSITPDERLIDTPIDSKTRARLSLHPDMTSKQWVTMMQEAVSADPSSPIPAQWQTLLAPTYQGKTWGNYLDDIRLAGTLEEL